MSWDETLTSADGDSEESDRVDRHQSRLADRYVLINEVGAGGSGLVFQAFDRELERRVAIKLLKAPGSAGVSSTRLRREAQANALLQHPNVVSVFDVGEHHGEVFLAMEYVGGGSLKAWLQAPRSQRQILEIFRQAGAGLLAAHRKGIVHRDFKPSNVLIGSDGRARVADFGLARTLGVAEPSDEETASSSGLVDLALTRTGALVGTPAYMAPEQFEDGPVDVRADQFAFCLSLAEALTQSSFPRETPMSVRESPPSWDTRAWLRGHRLPTRLREALVRGLAARKEDRFATLEPILQAIDACTNRSSSRAGWAGAAAAVAGAGLLVATIFTSQPCTGLDAKLTGVWDAARRGRLVAARPAPPWAAVWGGIDRYVDRWVEVRTEVCEATHLRGDQSAALLDARMTCLDRRLDALKVFTSFIEGGRIEDANQAAEAIVRLPGSGPCLDVVRPDGAPANPDEERRAAVEDIQAQFRELEALLAAGLFEDGLSAARAVAKLAEATGDDAVQAQAMELQGQFEQALDHYDEARPSWERAAVLSEAASDDLRRFDAYLGLVRLGQGTKAETGRTDRNVERARALIRRHRWGPRQQAALSAALTQLEMRRGHLVECRDYGRRARALLEKAVDAAWFERLEVSEALAICLNRLGSRKEAASIFREALDEAERQLGTDHPRVGRLYSRLSRAYDFSGDREGAELAAQRALDIAMRALGPVHSDTALAHQGVANVAFRRGDYQGSVDHLRTAIEIMTRVHGFESRQVGLLHSSLGLSLIRLERFDEGLASHRIAVDLLSRILGPRHPETGAARGRYGGALADSGDHEGALPECHMAMEILEQADPYHARILDQIRCLADSLLEIGRPEEAVELLRQGVEISEHRDETPYYRALLEFQTARALGATGSSDSGRRWAEKARGRLRTAGTGPDLLREVEAWLEKHPASGHHVRTSTEIVRP